MVFRAIICCTALIFALLAALSATAQSAGAPQPLNLMSFMQGSGKAGSAKAGAASAKTASTTKHRHGTARSAARPQRDATTTSAASSEPSAVAAASASQSDDNVQVVSGDEVNAIDLAMNNSPSETSGAASRADGEARDRFKFADASQFLPNQGKLDNTTPAKETAAGTGDARTDEIARESWMNRFWSAVGDGFVALAGMVRQLFS
jgi:hypothetical protein